MVKVIIQILILVCKEINGYDIMTSKQVDRFWRLLRMMVQHACGNWIYSGFYPEEGNNRAKNRDNIRYRHE